MSLNIKTLLVKGVKMAEEQEPGIRSGPEKVPPGTTDQQFEDLQQALLASHFQDLRSADDRSRWFTQDGSEPQQAREDPEETDRLERAKLREKQEAELRSNQELMHYMLETGALEEYVRLSGKADQVRLSKQASKEDKERAYADVNAYMMQQMKNLLEDPSREEKKARRSSPYWS
jgi:hypothetical protein